MGMEMTYFQWFFIDEETKKPNKLKFPHLVYPCEIEQGGVAFSQITDEFESIEKAISFRNRYKHEEDDWSYVAPSIERWILCEIERTVVELGQEHPSNG